MIERLIHGPEAVYNDISRWKWQELLNFFNADGHPHKTWLAETRGQFEEILSNDEFAKADKCQLIEVKMDRLDAPRALQLQAEMVSRLSHRSIWRVDRADLSLPLQSAKLNSA